MSRFILVRVVIGICLLFVLSTVTFAIWSGVAFCMSTRKPAGFAGIAL